MKLLTTILGAMLIAATAFSAPPQKKVLTPAQKKQAVLANLANLQLKQDVRTVIKFDKETGYCGGSAPSYIIEIQYKKIEKKVVSEDQGPELVEVWTTIKQYAISESELGDGTGYGAMPMDADRCL